jgi:phosphatidylglycerol---prolipoprotein diacylglyceryl transferase
MLPIIFSTGPVTIYSFGFLLAIGVFIKSFVIWRRLRDLGFKEEKILDFLILSLLLGFVTSRLIFILGNWQSFSFYFSRWFLFVRFPGFASSGWLLGFLLALWRFTRKEKWNFWRVADEITFGFLPFLILLQVGSFLDGSGFGRLTSLPWGIYFPGILLKRHPISLFFAISLLIVWVFLLKIERDWRTWRWYKSKESGFIFLVALFSIFLINFPLAFIKDNKIYFYWAEIILTLIGLIIIGSFFYLRSGRSFKKIYVKKEKEKENS